MALGNQKWQLHNFLFRGRCNHPPIIPAKLQSIPLVSNRNPFSAFASQSNEFERGSMEGSGGHSLAPTGCSKHNAPEQPSPGHDAHCAQSNARAEREGATRAEETMPPHIPAVRIWGPVPILDTWVRRREFIRRAHNRSTAEDSNARDKTTQDSEE